jgi:hypothetical protein
MNTGHNLDGPQEYSNQREHLVHIRKKYYIYYLCACLDDSTQLILSMSLNFITAWRTINDTIKRVLIWRFTLVLIKINYGQIGDQKEQESLPNAHVKIIGYQFGAKFKLVFCAKYDRGLDLGFWEMMKPLKWTNITSFFLIWLKRSTKIFISL